MYHTKYIFSESYDQDLSDLDFCVNIRVILNFLRVWVFLATVCDVCDVCKNVVIFGHMA